MNDGQRLDISYTKNTIIKTVPTQNNTIAFTVDEPNQKPKTKPKRKTKPKSKARPKPKKVHDKVPKNADGIPIYKLTASYIAKHGYPV